MGLRALHGGMQGMLYTALHFSPLCRGCGRATGDHAGSRTAPTATGVRGHTRADARPDLLAAAASSPQVTNVSLPVGQPATSALTGTGPYNPAASLPPKVVRRILNLEFVEMAELTADIWVDDPPATDQGHPARRSSAKPPITDVKVWLECYARMAALLVTRFPDKGPELWAYQTTILRAAHNYEGSNWVAYDRQFRRDMLARKDLNWSSTNARLYNEAFTGRAKVIPRCPHCLCEDHSGASCPHNPNPPVLGWFSDPRHLPQQASQSP